MEINSIKTKEGVPMNLEAIQKSNKELQLQERLQKLVKTHRLSFHARSHGDSLGVVIISYPDPKRESEDEDAVKVGELYVHQESGEVTEADFDGEYERHELCIAEKMELMSFIITELQKSADKWYSEALIELFKSDYDYADDKFGREFI